MASTDAYNFYLRKGLPVDNDPYNKFDSLESNDDLELLFEVLNTVRDSNGKNAVVTANNIVANPDFYKIKNSCYTEYHFERFTETLKKYPKHDKVEELYNVGIKSGVFFPQFHGREHVNISRWLKALQKSDPIALMAFKHDMFSIHASNNPSYLMEFMDSFDCDSIDQLSSHKLILQEGLSIFESLWNYKSRSFIAPCYTWNTELEQLLFEEEVKYIQGNYYQREPMLINNFNYKIRYHYTGQLNRFKQMYLVRNVFFEPSTNISKDWIDSAMAEIRLAFNFRRPAIIQTHRLNYIGSLVQSNREKNLLLLKKMLQSIITRWPDVVFMTSDQLGDELAV